MEKYVENGSRQEEESSAFQFLGKQLPQEVSRSAGEENVVAVCEETSSHVDRSACRSVLLHRAANAGDQRAPRARLRHERAAHKQGYCGASLIYGKGNLFDGK